MREKNNYQAFVRGLSLRNPIVFRVRKDIMKTQKILIIDDDQNIRSILSTFLKKEGYETFTTVNGVEGIDFLKRSSVNLAVIDLGLPDMSGLEVLEKVKLDNPFLEVIILTGNASLSSAIDATNKGAFSYLQKPINLEQLMLQVRRAIEKQEAQETIAGHNNELERMNAQLSESNRELKNEIMERKKAEEEKEKLIVELKESLTKIKTLSGLLPICSWCKKIRDDAGYWQQLEAYIGQHSGAEVSHSICPDCLKAKYPDTDEES
jgi:DNA-binding response OmpR family regulator